MEILIQQGCILEWKWKPNPESIFVGSRDDGGGKARSSGLDEDVDGSVGIERC